MRALDVKLLRDLGRLAPQVAAIALLGAIGIAVSVMARGGLKSIQVAQDRFYTSTRFADVFAGAERAPRALVERLRAIDGVVAVDARASGGGLMDVPGLDRPANVRLIALPDQQAYALNTVVLKSGRMPAGERQDEAVALQAFLDAAHVKIGQRLVSTIAGRQVALKIVGGVLSPEYVYSPSESALPDDAHQAVLFAPRPVVEGASGQVGAFAQVALRLSSDTNPEAVLPQVDRILAPYGGTPAVARVDQPSNRFLVEGIHRLTTLSVIVPPIFLLVAAGLTHMVISRLVETEREQIGLLKAFGFSDLEAALPYLKLSAVIGLFGLAAGGLVGAGMAAALTHLYGQYFRFPVLDTQFDWTVFAVTGVVAMASCLIGASVAAFRAARLRPAVAMQQAPPAIYRQGLFDHFGLTARLDQPSRMIMRRLTRFPGKALITGGGLALSLSLLVGTQFIKDALDHVIDATYYQSQRWTGQIGFFHPREVHVVAEAARLPGVYAAEPVRTTVAWAQGPEGRKRVAVMGLEPTARLARPLDARGAVIPFEGRGVILSIALAQRLGLKAGDRVDLDVIEGRRPKLLLPVTAIADDYTGLFVYIARGELNRLMGDGDLASGADLLWASDARAAYYKALTVRPQVVSALSRDDTVANWRETAAKEFSITTIFYLGFAGAIALGVAYNMGRITLAERSRDLATMQVLGFSRGECAYILYGEIVLIALLAAPVGVGLGIEFAHALAAAFSRDELRLPVTIGARTFALSITAYAAAVALSCLLLARQLWRLDLVGVLKTRE